MEQNHPEREMVEIHRLMNQEIAKVDKLVADVNHSHAILEVLETKLEALSTGKKNLLTLLLVCVGTILVAVSIFLTIRLGPEGYSMRDAQADRERLCELIAKIHPDRPDLCPIIKGDHRD